ncbi:MAG: OmpH family outer membrane protein [Paramuribaculum sp.]|nr:OmpH family outer membrane protein [Paramuribaculum sp.]
MLKKFIAAIIIAVPALTFAQGKFGIIKTQPIVEALPETKEAASQLEAASNKYQEEFKNFEDEMNKQVSEFQALGDDTPSMIKDRRMKDLQDLNNKMNEFRSMAERDLQRQQEQLFAPIQQKVHDAIMAVGKEGNFTFIFEDMVPVYTGSDVIDITDAVKAKLGVK